MARLVLALALVLLGATAVHSYPSVYGETKIGGWSAADVIMGGNAIDGTDGKCAIAGVPAKYTAGQTYTLTVTSSLGNSAFILAARDECIRQGDTAVGTTAKLTGGTPISGTSENFFQNSGGTGTAPQIEFEWTAPASAAAGSVEFQALCGQRYGAVSFSATATSTAAGGGAFDAAQCPSSKEPAAITADPRSSCNGQGWTRLVTVPTMDACFKVDNEPVGSESVSFRMSVTGAYGAIGFNSGIKMPGTKFMVLGAAPTGATVSFYQTTEYSGTAPLSDGNEPTAQEMLVSAKAKSSWAQQNGVLAGEWSVKTLGGQSVKELIKGTIIFATRSGAPASGPSKHDFDAKGGGTCAAGAASCTLNVALPATNGNLIHGSLMILAWITLSPTGTLFARYLKHIKKPWFETHRALQCLAVFVTVLAFIIIAASGVKFSELEGDSAKHAKMGLAVVILAIFQVLLGLLRNVISGEEDAKTENPTYDHDKYHHGPRRAIFNWLHKTNGLVLFIIGIWTVHLGLTVFPEGWVADPASDLLVAWVIILIICGVALEILHLTSSDEMYIPGWSENSTEKPTEMKLRAVVIAFLSAFSIATGIALIVIVADTDNTGEFKKYE